jgi:Spy/CpxP family protein refolding chaperone
MSLRKAGAIASGIVLAIAASSLRIGAESGRTLSSPGSAVSGEPIGPPPEAAIGGTSMVPPLFIGDAPPGPGFGGAVVAFNRGPGVPIGPRFAGVVGFEPEPGLQFGIVLRGVDLTPEQQARVLAIMDSYRPAFQKLFDQLRSTNEAMADRLLAEGTMQAHDFDSDVKSVTGLREQLMREGLNAALELRQVLTADQLAKASTVSKRLKELQSETRALLGDPAIAPAMMPPP